VSGKYVLQGRTPVVEPDLDTWAQWLETADRKVADDFDERTGIRISTVFLGLDHNHSQQGPPLLFETMVFGGLLDGETERYATWEDAERGHQALCLRVRATLDHLDL
jgi:hypothetical protein